jgi:hypothetical protein
MVTWKLVMELRKLGRGRPRRRATASIAGIPEDLFPATSSLDEGR